MTMSNKKLKAFWFISSRYIKTFAYKFWIQVLLGMKTGNCKLFYLDFTSSEKITIKFSETLTPYNGNILVHFANLRAVNSLSGKYASTTFLIF